MRLDAAVTALLMVRKIPGHIASHGATCMYLRPSRLSRPPQLGTLKGSPIKEVRKRATPASLFGADGISDVDHW